MRYTGLEPSSMLKLCQGLGGHLTAKEASITGGLPGPINDQMVQVLICVFGID